MYKLKTFQEQSFKMWFRNFYISTACGGLLQLSLNAVLDMCSKTIDKKQPKKMAKKDGKQLLKQLVLK